VKTGPAFEAFLARLYVDPAFREQVLLDPLQAAVAAGLSLEEAEVVAGLDREGLRLTCASLEKKRSKKN
jgi:hypothetical protein